MLLVDGAHERSGRWQDLVDEDEDCFLRRELDALANDIDKLTNSEVCGDEVLLLVDSSDVRFFHFLADDLDADSYVRFFSFPAEECRKVCLMTYRNPISILLSDALSFSLAFLKRVLILELGTHLYYG